MFIQIHRKPVTKSEATVMKQWENGMVSSQTDGLSYVLIFINSKSFP